VEPKSSKKKLEVDATGGTTDQTKKKNGVMTHPGERKTGTDKETGKRAKTNEP